MQLTIEFVSGETAGTRLEVTVPEEAPLLLGRGEDCDVPLWDEVASRRHALLENRQGELWLVDLGSANGTWIGEQRIDRRQLHGGEVVRIGSTNLRLETAGFRRRATEVVRPDGGATDRLRVLERLSWDEVDVGREVSKDAGGAERLNRLLAEIRALMAEEAGPKILTRFLDGGCDLLGVSRAAAVPCALHTGEPLWRETLPPSDPHSTLRPSRTLVSRVIAEREPLIIEDPHNDPDTKGKQSLVAEDVGAWLAVPIVARDRVHAVAIFSNRREDPSFDAGQLAIAATLGQVAALALSSAEKLETSRRLLAVQSPPREDSLIAEDETFRERVETLEQFSAAGGPLLIVGETGTGKELLARRAHRQSPNPEGPWVAVNCAALPGGLLESELFGHEEGAFTGAIARRPGLFELADGGTVFLDEIGELPPELQAKLLRVLESGEFYRIGGTQPVRVEVFVVSATHRDLPAAVEDGSFREDLLYRLGRFRVEVPPLRQRPDDLEPIALRVLESARRAATAPAPHLSEAAWSALRDYHWPGNVRELRNVLERAAVLAGGGAIEPSHLALPSDSALPAPPPTSETPVAPRSLAAVEEEAVRAALAFTEGHRGEAARILGVSEPTLRRKLRSYEEGSE